MLKYIDKQTCQKILSNSSKVILTTHTNPDGDAIGSELGMYYFLKASGKDVKIINNSETPANLQFLDKENIVKTYNYNHDFHSINNADLIIILDLNEPKRLNSMKDLIIGSNATKLLIDHHLEPQKFADYYYVNTDSASTGELVYDLIKDYNLTKNSIQADALYTAIMTDTGSFRFPKTTATTHRMIAEIIDLGADIVNCYEQVYNQNSMQATRLLGEAMSSQTLYFDDKVCIMTITKAMFDKSGAVNDDIDNFVEKTLSIKNVLFGVMISYMKDRDEVRVSFRSKDGFISAREVAQVFGGGGHHAAAGARLFGMNVTEAKSKIIEVIAKLISNAEKKL